MAAFARLCLDGCVWMAVFAWLYLDGCVWMAMRKGVTCYGFWDLKRKGWRVGGIGVACNGLCRIWIHPCLFSLRQLMETLSVSKSVQNYSKWCRTTAVQKQSLLEGGCPLQDTRSLPFAEFYELLVIEHVFWPKVLFWQRFHMRSFTFVTSSPKKPRW